MARGVAVVQQGWCRQPGSQLVTKDDAMLWKQQISALSPAGQKQPHSPARARIHSAFDEIAEAKTRGVTWQQITDLLTADGIRTLEGEPLTADLVRALFHTERYARGLRRKRKSKAKAVQPVTQAQACEPASFDPAEGTVGDRPRPKFGPARPR